VESLRCEVFSCGKHLVLSLKAESQRIWFAGTSVPRMLLRKLLLSPAELAIAVTQLAFEALKLGLATRELLSCLVKPLFRVSSRLFAAA
jgi:hypothetical protein